MVDEPLVDRQSFSLMHSVTHLTTRSPHLLAQRRTDFRTQYPMCAGMFADGSSSLRPFGPVLVFLQKGSDCAIMIVSADLCCVWQVFDFCMASHQWTHQLLNGCCQIDHFTYYCLGSQGGKLWVAMRLLGPIACRKVCRNTAEITENN